MSNIGTGLMLGKMGLKPTAIQVMRAQAIAKKKIGDLSFKPSDSQRKTILGNAIRNVIKADEAKKEESEAPKVEAPKVEAPKAEGTVKEYWLSMVKELEQANAKGEIKTKKLHDRYTSDRPKFFRVVNDVKFGKPGQSYVMFEWDEKRVTPANKNIGTVLKNPTDYRSRLMIEEGKPPVRFTLELQSAQPWKQPGDWDTHMLLYSDDKMNIYEYDDKKILYIMRSIIHHQL
jgi:hypothetical protein